MRIYVAANHIPFSNLEQELLNGLGLGENYGHLQFVFEDASTITELELSHTDWILARPWSFDMAGTAHIGDQTPYITEFNEFGDNANRCRP